jgi:hypothetical protein
MSSPPLRISVDDLCNKAAAAVFFRAYAASTEERISILTNVNEGIIPHRLVYASLASVIAPALIFEDQDNCNRGSIEESGEWRDFR